MQIVINIPEDLYEGIERRDGALETEYVCDELIKAVDNGTPLPKGHGRLIDADALIDTLGCSDRDIYVKACIEEDAPTIIEVDRSEEKRRYE
jgi:hypothetical protein